MKQIRSRSGLINSDKARRPLMDVSGFIPLVAVLIPVVAIIGGISSVWIDVPDLSGRRFGTCRHRRGRFSHHDRSGLPRCQPVRFSRPTHPTSARTSGPSDGLGHHVAATGECGKPGSLPRPSKAGAAFVTVERSIREMGGAAIPHRAGHHQHRMKSTRPCRRAPAGRILLRTAG